MKYIFFIILFTLLFVPSFIYLPVDMVLAKPSFEIYGSDETRYPSISSPFVGKSVDLNDLIVKASIYDVSGISSVVATIIDSNGNIMDSSSMLDDGYSPDTSAGDGIYTVKISNIQNFTPGTYRVKISAYDNLNNGPDFPIILDKTFVVERVLVKTCATSSGSTICVYVSNLDNSDQISFSAPNPASVKAGAGTSLTATFKTQTSGKTITFKDVTDNVIIGTAVTNSLGIANLSYAVSLSATLGSHTLKAEYAGSSSDDPSYKTTTLTVTSPGTCSTASGAIICVEISQ